ncbi:MAG: hypothetical protein AAGC63_01215 [Propionicimonas sp.]|nr:hypothetical protein [Propionicimonas sp.]
MTQQPSPPDWVIAAPFRAHLRHLRDGTGLPWGVLARVAGVSPRLVHHLVLGRGGRYPRRITHESASRLIALDRNSLARLAVEWVPAGRTRLQVRQLLAAGADPDRLAAWCRLSRTQLLALAGAARCTRLVALLVDTACPPHLAIPADEDAGREAA